MKEWMKIVFLSFLNYANLLNIKKMEMKEWSRDKYASLTGLLWCNDFIPLWILSRCGSLKEGTQIWENFERTVQTKLIFEEKIQFPMLTSRLRPFVFAILEWNRSVELSILYVFCMTRDYIRRWGFNSRALQKVESLETLFPAFFWLWERSEEKLQWCFDSFWRKWNFHHFVVFSWWI